MQPSETIFTIVNPMLLDMRFTLSEQQLHLINTPNKTLYVTFETYPNMRFNAVIDKFIKTSVGGSYPVTVIIDDSEFSLSKYDIKPGFSATVFLDVRNENSKGQVKIPITALAEDEINKRHYVWLYNSTDGVVKKRYVTSGALLGTDDITITSGIAAGDRVVSAGVYSLKNNQKVKLIDN